MNHQKPSSVSESDNNKMLIDFFEKRFKNLETLIQNNKVIIPDVYQPKEICEKLGWSRSKFEQFKKEKLFRTFKIGGKVYVYASDLLALFP